MVQVQQQCHAAMATLLCRAQLRVVRAAKAVGLSLDPGPHGPAPAHNSPVAQVTATRPPVHTHTAQPSPGSQISPEHPPPPVRAPASAPRCCPRNTRTSPRASSPLPPVRRTTWPVAMWIPASQPPPCIPHGCPICKNLWFIAGDDPSVPEIAAGTDVASQLSFVAQYTGAPHPIPPPTARAIPGTARGPNRARAR